MIYLCCSNIDITNHWTKNLKSSNPLQLLQKNNEIFDYSISSADIFILDIDFFDNINDTLTFINTLPKNLKVITIKMTLSLSEGTMLIKKGVKSYCNSFIDKDILKRLMETVELGDTWVYPSLMNYIIQNININNEPKRDNISLNQLSKKEKEVALLVASGNSNKDIAQSLGVALVTVKKHINNIFDKLDVKDRVSLSILINS